MPKTALQEMHGLKFFPQVWLMISDYELRTGESKNDYS